MELRSYEQWKFNLDVNLNGTEYPLERIGEPEDIAEMILYLLSEKAYGLRVQFSK